MENTWTPRDVIQGADSHLVCFSLLWIMTQFKKKQLGNHFHGVLTGVFH